MEAVSPSGLAQEHLARVGRFVFSLEVDQRQEEPLRLLPVWVRARSQSQAALELITLMAAP